MAKIAALCIAERSADQVFELIREEYPIPRPDFDATLKRLVTMGVLQLQAGRL